MFSPSFLSGQLNFLSDLSKVTDNFYVAITHLGLVDSLIN